MTERAQLRLEVREQPDLTAVFGGGAVIMTPPVGEDYWLFRVQLSDRQAVIGFPKFGTIGIGFAEEEGSWNTNLPYRSGPAAIAAHIAENKGDDSIADSDVLRAIEMVCEAARLYREGPR